MTEEMTDSIKFPTVHLNGTGGKTLVAEYRAAMDAVKAARKALAAATLNGRDYYPQGPEAFEAARDQRMEMNAALDDVFEKLQIITIGIMDQIK